MEPFEKALANVINACGSSFTGTGIVSFILDFSFRRTKTKVHMGKSSTIPKNETEQLFTCVRDKFAEPDWATTAHQHSRYIINVRVAFPLP